MDERTDRELLELAGRAAGEVAVTKGVWKEHDPMDGHPCYDCGFGFPETGRIAWNPLKRDGDALRLGARLGIFMRTDFICRLSALMQTGMDHTAATRRAIVQVAALIAEKGIAAAAMAEGGEHG